MTVNRVLNGCIRTVSALTLDKSLPYISASTVRRHQCDMAAYENPHGQRRWRQLLRLRINRIAIDDVVDFCIYRNLRSASVAPWISRGSGKKRRLGEGLFQSKQLIPRTCTCMASVVVASSRFTCSSLICTVQPVFTEVSDNQKYPPSHSFYSVLL